MSSDLTFGDTPPRNVKETDVSGPLAKKPRLSLEAPTADAAVAPAAVEEPPQERQPALPSLPPVIAESQQQPRDDSIAAAAQKEEEGEGDPADASRDRAASAPNAQQSNGHAHGAEGGRREEARARSPSVVRPPPSTALHPLRRPPRVFADKPEPSSSEPRLHFRLVRGLNKELGPELDNGCFDAVHDKYESVGWVGSDEINECLFKVLVENKVIAPHLAGDYPYDLRQTPRPHLVFSLVWHPACDDEGCLRLAEVPMRDAGGEEVEGAITDVVYLTVASLAYMLLRPLTDAVTSLIEAFKDSRILVATSQIRGKNQEQLIKTLDSFNNMSEESIMAVVSVSVERHRYPQGPRVTEEFISDRLLSKASTCKSAEDIQKCAVCKLYGIENFQLMCDYCEAYESHTFCRPFLPGGRGMDEFGCEQVSVEGTGNKWRTGGIVSVPKGTYSCSKCSKKGVAAKAKDAS